MKIKEWLRSENVSAREFAKVLGIDQAHLSRIMNYKKSASLILSQRIYELSDGEIPHHEMLSDEDLKELLEARKTTLPL